MTIDTFVPAVQQSDITVVQNTITPQQVAAVNALKTGRIPLNAIQQHPGKGGKVFTYVSHIHGTKTMNDAFDQFWDIETLSSEVYSDSSVTARVRVTLHFFTPDGVKFHQRVVTQTGAKEAVPGMSIANLVLSAESRGLMRCMLRLFNYGAEFYKDGDDDPLTPGLAWDMLKKQADGYGVGAVDLGNHFKEIGFQKEQLVERFAEAWQECYDYCSHIKAEREAAKKAEKAAEAEKKNADNKAKYEEQQAAKKAKAAEKQAALDAEAAKQAAAIQ